MGRDMVVPPHAAWWRCSRCVRVEERGCSRCGEHRRAHTERERERGGEGSLRPGKRCLAGGGVSVLVVTLLLFWVRVVVLGAWRVSPFGGGVGLVVTFSLGSVKGGA